MKPDIPPEQLEQIEPLVDRLLAPLRQKALQLPSDAGSALAYDPEPEDPA